MTDYSIYAVVALLLRSPHINREQEIDNPPRKPLALASELGHHHIMELLISHECAVNCTTPTSLYHYCSLHHTLRQNDAVGCKILLKAGAKAVCTSATMQPVTINNISTVAKWMSVRFAMYIIEAAVDPVEELSPLISSYDNYPEEDYQYIIKVLHAVGYQFTVSDKETMQMNVPKMWKWLNQALKSPHTLVDLSRRVIRQCMQTSVTFATEKLSYPTPLKHLILLQDFKLPDAAILEMENAYANEY